MTVEGTILTYTKAAFGAGSSINGHVYTQTATTLVSTTVISPEFFFDEKDEN